MPDVATGERTRLTDSTSRVNEFKPLVSPSGRWLAYVRRVTLGRAELQVFLYPDSSVVARDLAALDTVRVARPGEAGRWQVRPTFMRSANLVALLLSTNERQIERVQLALTAGSGEAARLSHCPKCGETAIIYQEGCAPCLACDYSNCG